MSELHKKQILTLLVIVLLLALFLPALFGAPRMTADETGGDAWRNFVYDFQTLITGVLAIAAAFFTIRSAQAIDERQQLRHEQIYELQTRADKLRISRAYTSLFWIQNYGYPVVKGNLPDYPDGFDNVNSQQKRDAMRLEQMVRSTLAYLESVEITGVRDLFEGELHRDYENLIMRLEQLERRLKRLSADNGEGVSLKIGPGMTTSEPMSPDLRKHAWHEASSLQPHVRTHLEDFVRNFQALAKIYKVI